MIDTHSHINMIKSWSEDEIVQTAKDYGVNKIIVPTAHPDDIKDVMALIEKFDNVYGMLGIHPSECASWTDELENTIKNYSNHKKIVAIGEIGLDYYWDKSNIELQKEVFIKQIKLANELNLPIAIHDREAHKDTMDILAEYNKNSTVIMHCFSGSVELAKECIKRGYYIALGGVVTFKNAVKTKEVAKYIPLDYLLLETDSPFLTPVPHRGEENQPAYTKFVAEEISNLTGKTLSEIDEISTQNTEKVFNL